MTVSEESPLFTNLNTGWLCLDFANTYEWRSSDSPVEYLPDIDALISWLQARSIVDASRAAELSLSATRSKNAAKDVHSSAINLREAIYRIFSRIAAGGGPAPDDLDIFNSYISRYGSHRRITKQDQMYHLGWGEIVTLDGLLWAIISSTSDLLTSANLNRIGECADEKGCAGLFYDTSRNRSRRWCDMRDCGNRDKVRRYYARKREDD